MRGVVAGVRRIPGEHRKTIAVTALAAVSLAVQLKWPERAAHLSLGLTVIAAGWLGGQVAGRIVSEYWRHRYHRANARAAGWRHRAVQAEVRQVLDQVRAEARSHRPAAPRSATGTAPRFRRHTLTPRGGRPWA